MELGLKGRRIAILAGDGVNARELNEPREALEGAGATVQVVAPRAGELEAEDGPAVRADCALDACRASDFQGLVLPGGKGAETLAGDQRAVQFVREFMLADKPVASICHGAALLVAADAVAGRTLTGHADVRERVIEAGGSWVDGAVQVDEHLVTSRGPQDLLHFTRAIVRQFGNRLDESRMDRVVEQSFPASDPAPGPSSIGGAGAAKDMDIDRQGGADARP
jgi:protease I